MIYTKHFLMKYLISIMLLSASSLCAQKIFVVDTFLNPDVRSLGVGKGYAMCLVPIRLFRNDTLTGYDLSYEKRRFFTMTIMPPQYDSTRVQLLPEYSYWVLRKNARRMIKNKHILRIEPPTYTVINVNRKVGENPAILIKGTKSREALSLDTNDCHVVRLTEVLAEYKSVQRHTLKDSAKIVYRKAGKQWTEVLDSTSPLLMRVTVPPQYGHAKTNDYRKQRIIFESDIDIKGYLSDWREYNNCGGGPQPPLYIGIQRALAARGYLEEVNEKISYINRKTKKALRRFQRDKGLPVGIIDDNTLKSLGLYSN